MAEERLSLLPADGFFASLRRSGTWARRMRYPYAITDTAPGHAALHTGKTPAETHIVVNSQPDDKTGKRTSRFRDPATKIVTAEGTREAIGSSAWPLAAPTVADRLKAANPKAKVISVSLKDRAALLPAGKHPDHAIWYEPGEDAFATSTAIEATLPAWAAPGDRAAVKKARAAGWAPLDRDWCARHATKDDAPGEGDLDGMGTTFPHAVPSTWAFRATPLSDPMILDIALAGVRAERDPKEPLLLLVSISASDLIMHAFGPDSWESWDHLRRLDRELARFLRELEAMTGPVSVVLSADHGNSSMLEARPGCKAGQTRLVPNDPYDRPCGGGERIIPDRLRDELRDEATKAFGDPAAIAGVSDGYVFLSAIGRAYEPAKRAKLDELVGRVLRTKHKAAVEEIFDTRTLATKCPAALASAPPPSLTVDPLLVMVCRSWAPDVGAGDYYVVPTHGSYFDGEIVAGHGDSHGTPWLFDRTVPLLVRGPGVPAGVAFDEPIDFTAYSRLEAAFLGLTPETTPAKILQDVRLH